MGLCNWTCDTDTYVLTKEECEANHIEITSTDGTFHTTINQTINDLLADDTMDEQVILESIADQYFADNYAKLTIKPENQDTFNYFRPMAEEYYDTNI